MTSLIDFGEALRRTGGADRTLLVGNGFSSRYFSYANLLSASNLRAGVPVRELFDALGTVDFELVVRTLENARDVERVYGEHGRANQFHDDALIVREALVRAVNNTHPLHRQVLGPGYTSSATFLSEFSTVFTLNYDLLLYWVNLEKGLLRDGFGLGGIRSPFIGPFREDAFCSLYNLHGGLHLFDDGAGGVVKALDGGRGVVATITDTIGRLGRFPVYVAEGTSAGKMARINSNHYLRHCYNALRRNLAVVFVYGHSADDNDAHVYRAIFGSEAEHVYFGIYRPDETKVRIFDGQLAKYQRSAGSRAGYTFFDSASAGVWDA